MQDFKASVIHVLRHHPWQAIFIGNMFWLVVGFFLVALPSVVENTFEYVLGLLGIAAFAATYVYAFYRFARHQTIPKMIEEQ